MTTIQFTYYAIEQANGTHRVNLYIKQNEPDWEGTPFGERKAIKDAAEIVREIVSENEELHPDDRLLIGGEPPAHAFPVFTFAIGVDWNREYRNAHYSRVMYQRYLPEAKWNPIAALGMEQFDYTMGVLRKHEKKMRKPRSKAQTH